MGSGDFGTYLHSGSQRGAGCIKQCASALPQLRRCARDEPAGPASAAGLFFYSRVAKPPTVVTAEDLSVITSVFVFQPAFPGIGLPRPGTPQSERGVVLILALVLLTVISMLTVFSLRNAGSSESVASNTRVIELATQAAEISLRHCEASIVKIMTVNEGGADPYETTFDNSKISPASSPPLWQNKALWDGDSASVFVLPLTLLNQPGMSSITYKRAPECMVERLPIVTGVGGAATFFVITARGFGPEVPALASAARIRPVGSEIWLQSNISMKLE